MSNDRTSGARRRMWLLVALALAAYGLVATFPERIRTVPGLDGAWRLEVNRLGEERLFAADAAFTYGPLGSALVPDDGGGPLLLAALLRFAVQAAVAASLAWLVLRGKLLQALAVLATWIVAAWSGLMLEHELLLILTVLALHGMGEGRWRGFVLASALAGAAVFVKMSLAYGALGACGIAALLALFRGGIRGRRAIAAAATAFVVVVAMLGSALFRSWSDLAGWLRTSLQIANGYSAAMSVEGPPEHVAIALGFVAAVVVLAAWLLARRSPAAGMALALAAPTFLTFKHAFVRHDGYHEVAFLPFVSAALAAVLASTEERVEKAISGGLLVVILLTTAWRTHVTPGHLRLRDILTGAPGLENARSWADVRGEALRQRKAIDLALAQEVVPGLRERLGASTVAVIPWELSYCRANGLRCIPNPTLQLYSAYTAALDLRTANHFADQDAPESVLVEDRAIDGRNVVLDTPATIWALLAGYREEGEIAQGLRLLRKRSSPVQIQPRTIGRSTLLAGRWTPVPESRGLLLASMDLEQTFWGRLTNVLYKIGPVYLDVVYCDGTLASYRIVPDTARNGMLLNNLGRVRGLDDTLQRHAGSRPARVRISGPGLRAFERQIPVTWAEVAAAEQGPPTCEPAGPVSSMLQRTTAPMGKPLLAVDLFAVEGEDGEPGIVRVRGWAVDPVAERSALGVLIEVGGTSHWVPVGLPRADVAAYFGQSGYALAGFSGSIDLAGLAQGRHEVTFKVVDADGRAFFETDEKREIVTP